MDIWTGHLDGTCPGQCSGHVQDIEIFLEHCPVPALPQAGLAFWPRPKIFGQFGRPKWPNSQNSQFSAKFWPNNTHNIVLILIRNGLAFGRGQRFFWPVCPAKLAKRPNANTGNTYRILIFILNTQYSQIK